MRVVGRLKSSTETMENESLFNERQSIRDSARQLKKYGSTCNHVRNNDVFIRHNLDQSDTLQGIALKYGCTVRINSISELYFHSYFIASCTVAHNTVIVVIVAAIVVADNSIYSTVHHLPYTI